MRLIVARCSVDYSGRLTARLPEALRLLMVKADGSVLVHADAGGYKPLNWMTPPTVIEEEPGLIVVRKLKADDRLEIRIAEVISDSTHDDGPRRRPREGRRGGPPAGGAGRRARLVRRGLPARPPRMADRHRPGRPDVPRRRRRLDRGRDQARRHDRRGRAADAAISSGSGSTPRSASAAACSRRRWSSRRRGCSRRRAGSAWVEVDLAVLRGEAEPALTLFG